MLPRSVLALALLLVVGGAAAQAPAPSFAVDTSGLPGPVEPGSTSDLVMTVKRLCPNPAVVLQDQSVEIEFKAAGEIQVAGQRTLTFPQHACATQAEQAIEAHYDVAVDRYADHSRAFRVSVELYPTYGSNPAVPPGEGARLDFLVSTTPAKELEVVAQQTPEQEAPGPAAAVLVMAILGVAVMLRRRA